MKRTLVILALLVLALTLNSCKSVETTSAMLHNQHKNYEKAIEMALLALEKNPQDAEAHFQLGISYSFTGKMRESFEEFMTAARIDPKKTNDAENNITHNWAKHFNNGVSDYQAENLVGAAKEFDMATKSDPRAVKGWLNLAKVYHALSEEDSTYLEPAYVATDTLVSRTTPEDDEYSAVLTLAGQVMVSRGDKERALEIFDRLLLDDPANYEAVEKVGYVYLGTGEAEAAVDFLKMAVEARLKTDSESFDLYYNLGVAYYQMEKWFQAIDAYQSAINVSPEDQQANYSLLLTYWKGELWDEAVAQGQKYTGMFPDDPRGYQILSLSYNKKGMKMKAEEAFMKYKELTGQ
ncbi:MAG: tetratricopeptide repeat protein [Candidatus Krumholzibacteriota bacterium]|nr:tetratricopeptide repeat protein [Candidatus Krumholzibacteriota bacterium]